MWGSRRRIDDDDDDDDSSEGEGSHDDDDDGDDGDDDGDVNVQEEVPQGFDEDDSSYVSFEPSHTVLAPFEDLVLVLRKFKKVEDVNQGLRNTCEELFKWSELHGNDHSRETEKVNGMWLASLDVEQDGVGGLNLALAVRDVLFLLLKSKDAASEEPLAQLLYFLDVLPSVQGQLLEWSEGLVRNMDTARVPFAALWSVVDDKRLELSELVRDRALDVVAGNVTTFSVPQVLCMDRLRDFWTGLMMNWAIRGPSTIFVTSDPFLGLPLTMPWMVPNELIDYEHFLLNLPSECHQRSVLLYLEAFVHLFERDLFELIYEVNQAEFADVPYGTFRKMLLRALESEAVDNTTKLFVLRVFAACPRIMFGGPEDDAPAVPIKMLAGLLQNTKQPFMMYQVTATLMLLLECDVPDDRVENAVVANDDVPFLMSATFKALTRMRRVIANGGQHGTNISECAPALGYLHNLMEGIFNMDLLRGEAGGRRLMSFIEYLYADAVPLALRELRALTAHKDTPGYLDCTLSQLCAFQFDRAQLFEGNSSLHVTHPLPTLHALISRLVRASLCSSYLEVLQGYWLLTVNNPSPEASLMGDTKHLKAGLEVLAQLAENMILNKEFMEFFAHPAAPSFVQRWLHGGVMNRFVNGGPLDTDSLRERDFFYMLYLIPVRLVLDFAQALETAFQTLPREDALPDLRERLRGIWLRIIDSIDWKDSPTLLKLEQEELKSVKCTQQDWKRLSFLLSSQLGQFVSLLGVAEIFPPLWVGDANTTELQRAFVKKLVDIELQCRLSDQHKQLLLSDALAKPDQYSAFFRTLRRSFQSASAVIALFLGKRQLVNEASQQQAFSILQAVNFLSAHWSFCKFFFDSCWELAQDKQAWETKVLRKVCLRNADLFYSWVVWGSTLLTCTWNVSPPIRGGLETTCLTSLFESAARCFQICHELSVDMDEGSAASQFMGQLANMYLDNQRELRSNAYLIPALRHVKRGVDEGWLEVTSDDMQDVLDELAMIDIQVDSLSSAFRDAFSGDAFSTFKM